MTFMNRTNFLESLAIRELLNWKFCIILLWVVGVHYFIISDKQNSLWIMTIVPFILTAYRWIICVIDEYTNKNSYNIKIDKYDLRQIGVIYVYYIFIVFISLWGYDEDLDNISYNIFSTLIVCFSIIFCYLFGIKIWEKLEVKGMQNIVENVVEDENIQKQTKVDEEIKFKSLTNEERDKILEKYKDYIYETSLKDFEKFIKGEKIENKIRWIGTSGKKVITYTRLFLLFHILIDRIDQIERSKMIKLIIENFVKYSEEKRVEEDMIYSRVYSGYAEFLKNSLKKSSLN